MGNNSDALLLAAYFKNKVIFHGSQQPAGTIACEIMNLSADKMAHALELCKRIAPVNALIRNIAVNYSQLNDAARASGKLISLISDCKPFAFMKNCLSADELAQIYSESSLKNIPMYYRKLTEGKLDTAAREKLRFTIALIVITPMFANFYDSVSILQQSIGGFAERLGGGKPRTQRAYLEAAQSAFPENFELGGGSDAWASMANVTVQYSAGSSEGSSLQMQRKMHFVSFGGLFRADFF